MKSVNYLKNFSSERHIFVRFSEHISVRGYPHSVPYLVSVFFRERSQILTVLQIMHCSFILLIHPYRKHFKYFYDSDIGHRRNVGRDKRDKIRFWAASVPMKT